MKPNFRNVKSFAILSILSVILPCSVLRAQHDIGVTALSDPAIPFCAGTHSVEVVLQNFGADTVFTANLAWTVNGVSQLSFAFNDTLIPSEAQQVVIGSFFFSRKSSYQLSVVSSSPNGLPDADPSNDSLVVSNLISRMSGSYSAGIVADYATLADAVNDLEGRGVCSAVVININPGIFNEQLKIQQVAGASDVNTITFQSSTADSTSVIITFPSSASALNNYTILFDGADHFIFNQLTLERRGSLPNARVVELSRNATGNVFTNLCFTGALNTTDSSQAAIVYSDSSAAYRDTANYFLNSLFTNGASAIFFEGPSHSYESAIAIENNHFVNQYAGGLFLKNQENVQVLLNEFRTNTTYSGYVAIDGFRCLRESQFLTNRISSPGGGIFLSACEGNSTARILVANNFIQAADSAGLVLDGALFLDAVYNSIQQVSANPEHSALLVSGTTAATRVMNNVLVNSGGGVAYTIRNSAHLGLAASDYNDLYAAGITTGRLDGVDLLSLPSWTLASGLDSNSVSTDPLFVSATDLHASSYFIDNKGIPFGAVSDDIDGEQRSASKPDIGADEFSAVIHDLEITSLLSPGVPACEDSVTRVSLLVHNAGDFDESGFTIHAQISGAAVYQLLDTILGTIPAGAYDTLTFSQAINSLGGGVFTIQSFISSPTDIEPGNDSLLSVRTIFPYLPPAVASGTQVCGQDSVLLTASGSNVLYWYDEPTGGQLLDTGSTQVYFAAGSDTLFVQNGATCPVSRVAVPIRVYDLPVVTLGNDTTISFPQTVTLIAATGYNSYLWNTGDTSNSIVVDSTGLYTVTVTDSNGCSGSDTILVDVLTTVRNLSGAGDLQLFPNPATGIVHVEWYSLANESITLTLQDVAGREVYKSLLPSGIGLIKTDVAVDRLPRGIYLLQVQAGAGITSKRLVLY